MIVVPVWIMSDPFCTVPLIRISIGRGGILKVTEQLKMKEPPSITSTLPDGTRDTSGAVRRMKFLFINTVCTLLYYNIYVWDGIIARFMPAQKFKCF